MVEIKNLIKNFNNTIAVNDISFKVEPGRIFGLLGPNGAGKTTTIRMILNIIKPTSGKVLFFGKEINNEFLNIAGYLPEERGLYKKSKVIDVITYFAVLKGIDRSHAIKSAQKWLNRLEILHYAGSKIEELSKGNQQKIQFISTVIHNPQVLILDEPFSGLDIITQQIIKNLITQFSNEKKIIIFSSHMMEFAEQLCSDIFLINKGKEIMYGSLVDIKNKFGKNTYRIEFEGNPLYLVKYPGLQSVSVNKNIAEFKLEDYYPAEELLKNLVNVVNIRSFTKVEPSLKDIFIKMLSANPYNEEWYEKSIENCTF